MLLRSLRLLALSDAPDSFRGTLTDEMDFPLTVWDDLVTDTENPFFVIEVDNEACGICGVFAPDVDHRAQLWFLWLAPSHRGRGKSDEIVRHVIDWAKAEGAASVLLHVTEGNLHAEGLYLRHGFSRTGISIERERDGAIEIEMELDLSAPEANPF